MIASLVLGLSSQPNVTQQELSDLLTPVALASIQALVLRAYPPPNTPNVTVDQVVATLVNSTTPSSGSRRRRVARATPSPSPAPGHFSIVLSFHSTLTFPKESGIPDSGNVSSSIVAVSSNITSAPVSIVRLSFIDCALGRAIQE